MAPIMTAVELTFNPTDATMMAKASIQTFGPLNSTLEPKYNQYLIDYQII